MKHILILLLVCYHTLVKAQDIRTNTIYITNTSRELIDLDIIGGKYFIPPGGRDKGTTVDSSIKVFPFKVQWLGAGTLRTTHYLYYDSTKVEGGGRWNIDIYFTNNMDTAYSVVSKIK